MSHPLSAPEARYAALVEALVGREGVTQAADGPNTNKGFGARGQLKIHGKIFAMLVRGQLVVKLPKRRVDALVGTGAGERFDPRHDGRLMKEWVTIEPTSTADWLSLAREALEYVGSQQ
jgi:hypothetical protein